MFPNFAVALCTLLALLADGIHHSAIAEEVVFSSPEGTMIAEKSEIIFQIMEQKDSASSSLPERWNILIIIGEMPVAGWNCGKQKPTFDFAAVLGRMRDIIQSSDAVDMREFPMAAGADQCRWPS